MNNKKAIFNKIINKGEIVLQNEFSKDYPIKRIKAVHFVDQLSEDYSVEEWNKNVSDIRNAIGVDCYAIRIRKNGKVVGVMAFFDKHNKEIKEKYFGEKRWTKLANRILKLT